MENSFNQRELGEAILHEGPASIQAARGSRLAQPCPRGEQLGLAVRLAIANKEIALLRKDKEKRTVELITINKTLYLRNSDQRKRAAELVIANKELAYQNGEKEKRALDLLRANQHLENLIDHANAPIIVWDPQGRITRFNRASETLTGLTEAAMLGKSMKILLASNPEALVMDLIRKTTTGERWEAQELDLLCAGEELRTMLWNSATIFEPDGTTPVATIAQGLDLTERKQAEAERLLLNAEINQIQKLEGLGRMAGGVAHDMNNVLGAILALASAHLLLEPSDSLASSAFATIRDASVRGRDMVNRLLRFARQQPMENRPVNLNALLLEQVRLMEYTKLAGVHLEMALAPDLRFIQGDESSLANAFMNLCGNAVDAMAQGGTLTLMTRNLGSDQVEAMVADTGCGMTPDVLAKATDPFYTTKVVGKGTGLGLSVVFTTVKANRGELIIQSEPGQGTQVRLHFPVAPNLELGSTPTPQRPLEPTTGALNLLLVDDDDLIRTSIQMVAGLLGHTITVAASGEEAIALVEQGACPEVVILDMNMPGLGGQGTLPRLRALRPGVPILLATGRADEDALSLAAAYPDVTLLAKPFSIEDLQWNLMEVIRAR